MLTTLLYSFKNSFEHGNKWFTSLIDDFSSLWVYVLIIYELIIAPKTSETERSFPAVVNEKDHTIDGPWLDSHEVKVEFPEVFIRGDFHIFSPYHFIPLIIFLLMFDDFVRREQLISCVKCPWWLLNFRVLPFFSLNIRIIFGPILQP